jgi:hypothetical protein
MLTVPVGPDRERAVRATRFWFELCAGRLTGPVDALPADATVEVGVKLDPPEGITGTPWEWDAPYSPAAWAELLQRIDPMPDFASYEAWTDSTVLFGVSMWATAGFAELHSTIADGVPDEVILATAREVAEMAAPVAAAVAIDSKFLTSPLEVALRRYGSGVSEAVTFLRNYGWLTVLSNEMAERVGGGARLHGSGAFVQAQPLRAGGWWLLATRTWEEYGPEQANRLFELLAPLLPPGKPRLSEFRPVTMGGLPLSIKHPNVVAERDAREITG